MASSSAPGLCCQAFAVLDVLALVQDNAGKAETYAAVNAGHRVKRRCDGTTSDQS